MFPASFLQYFQFLQVDVPDIDEHRTKSKPKEERHVLDRVIVTKDLTRSLTHSQHLTGSESSPFFFFKEVLFVINRVLLRK